MRRAGALAFATAMIASPALAAPPDGAGAQSLPSLSRLTGEPRVEVHRRGVSFPVVQYQSPDGVLRVRRGIIAGKQVAPGTVLGLGLFETAPKARGYIGDVPANMAPPKRSRRAAVGLSWRF